MIGNPPYFNVDATYGARHPVPGYLKTSYAPIWQDKTDIYYFFLTKGIALARQRLGFIVSRSFLEADKARRTRGNLAQHARLEHVSDLDGFRVFPDAGIATVIVVFDTSQAHGNSDVAVRRLDSAAYSTAQVIEGLRQSTSPFEVFTRRTKLGQDPWRFPNPYTADLYARIDSAGEHLGNVCFLGKGMETAANSVFGKLSDSDVSRLGLPRELLKRRARNSDIHRFYLADSGENVLYVEDVAQYSDLSSAVRHYLEDLSQAGFDGDCVASA